MDDGLPGFVEQYARFLPLANRIAEPDVRVARVDVSLVVLNASRGVETVLARRADLAALPGISIPQIESLADLGRALQYAAAQVASYVAVTGETKTLVATAHRVRGKLLAKADVLVLDGIIPAATVAGIRKGFGPIDTANDCIVLSALYHQHAAAAAGHVHVTDADIAEANAIGEKLLAAIRPELAKKAPEKARLAAAAARDRLWTLFEQTWEQQVRRPGLWLFGDDVDALVPSLGARLRGKRPSKPAPVVPAPAPSVATS